MSSYSSSSSNNPDANPILQELASIINPTTSSSSNSGPAILLAVIEALLGSVNNCGLLTSAETNVIQQETDNSMNLNKSIQGLTAVTAPSNATQGELANVNTINQNQAIFRQSILGEVQGINQQIKTNTTIASQQANALSQCSTEISSILQMAQTLAQLCSQMSTG